MVLQPAASSLGRLTLRDIEIVRDLGRLQSLRELARRLSMEPSQVSRIVARVEKALGYKVLERSVSGIAFTERGRLAVERFGEACALFDEARGEPAREAPTLAVGSSAFLNSRLVAPVVASLAADGTAQWRMIDLPPDDTVMNGLRGAFALAVHLGKLEWPRTWTSKRLGSASWGLFARKGHPLASRSRLDETALRDFAFTTPVYWTPSGLAYGNDFCPLKRESRRLGTATSTAESALQVMLSSDELAFLPEIVAREAVLRREAQQVHVKGWAIVERPLHLSARSESVTRKTFDRFAEGLAGRLRG